MTRKRLSKEECLSYLKQIAQDNGGKLLDSVWSSVETPLNFIHQNGKNFSISYKSLKNPNIGWPHDLEVFLKRQTNFKKTPEERLDSLKLLAKEHSCKLISTKWDGYHSSYEFIFEDGTSFTATYQYINQKGWPIQGKYLKSNQDYFNELKIFVENKGGKLLSKEWVGYNEKYLFEHNDGVNFWMTAKNIQSRGWPSNIDNYIKLSNAFTQSDDFFMKKMQDKAIENGGKLLSNKWKGKKYKYNFMDCNDVEFSIAYDVLIKGQWTPERGLISEPVCRQAIEHLFDSEFKKTRRILIAELLNRSSSLELDGYNEKNKVAFEYQGHPAHWDKNHKMYEDTIKKDNLKKKYCKSLGITLVEILPLKKDKMQFDAGSVLSHVLESVIKTFIESNKKLPKLNLKNFQLDFKKIHHSNNMLNELKKYAENKNVKLVSDKWEGASSSYLFKSQDGREFKLSYNNIKSNTKLNINRLLKTEEDYIDELKEIAMINNGELLSKSWLGSQDKYLFKDINTGLIFTRRADTLKSLGWPKNVKQLVKDQKLNINEIENNKEKEQKTRIKS